MSPSSERQYSVAVVGGGIGGLCTVIGLINQGVPVQIYEAAPAFAEIGAGVSFGPNASRAMRAIDPAIYAGFEVCATGNQWPDRQRSWFSFRKGEEDESEEGQAGSEGASASQGMGTRFCDVECENGQTSVHRAKYLDELVKLVPEGVAHFGKRLESLEDQGEKVVLKFHDGTTATHDAVIACDGIKSVARVALLGEDAPDTARAQFSGKYAYRGLIPMQDAIAHLGEELAVNAHMYFGHGGHILTFPIEKGKTMNVVAFSTKESWDDEQWVKSDISREDMYKDFEGWTPSTHAILEMMQKPDVWALFDHPPAPYYFKNRVVLAGDAAHASTPHNGAGAGQAIEDALVLSRLLGDVHDPKDLPAAFEAYDAVRRPRSQAHVRASRESGLLYDLMLPGYGDDWEKIRANLLERMKWIWNVDLEGEVTKAKGIFEEVRQKRQS